MSSLARAAALVTLVALTGCLDYDEVLTLESDGSGRLTVDVSVDMAFYFEKVKPLLPEGESEDAGVARPFTKEDIEKDCAAKGVKIEKCLVEDTGKTKTRLRLALAFESLEALRSVRRFSDRELDFDEKEGDVTVSYKVDPRSALAAVGFDPDAKAKAKDEKDKKIAQALDDARKASRARFALKLPGKVVKTDGTQDAGDAKTARWLVDRTTPEKLDAATRSPIEMTASVKKADAGFFEKEKERKKKAAEKAEAEKREKEKAPSSDGE